MDDVARLERQVSGNSFSLFFPLEILPCTAITAELTTTIRPPNAKIAANLFKTATELIHFLWA